MLSKVILEIRSNTLNHTFWHNVSGNEFTYSLHVYVMHIMLKYVHL